MYAIQWVNPWIYALFRGCLILFIYYRTPTLHTLFWKLTVCSVFGVFLETDTVITMRATRRGGFLCNISQTKSLYTISVVVICANCVRLWSCQTILTVSRVAVHFFRGCVSLPIPAKYQQHLTNFNLYQIFVLISPDDIKK